jgi:hypothetical protein
MWRAKILGLVVINNTIHGLVLGKINRLIVVYLIRSLSDRVATVWLPYHTLSLQILQLLL